jgi:hypothetical protein
VFRKTIITATYQLLVPLHLVIIEHNAINYEGGVHVQHNAYINMALDASE